MSAVHGWDVRTWDAATPPCPVCGHDAAAHAATLRRRHVTGAEHEALVEDLLVGAVDEIRPWQDGAYLDALRAGYVALAHEWVGLALRLLTDEEIVDALDVMALTAPPAVCADVLELLELTRVRYRELGIERGARPRVTLEAAA